MIWNVFQFGGEVDGEFILGEKDIAETGSEDGVMDTVVVVVIMVGIC